MARRPPQDPSDPHGTGSALREPVGPKDRSVYVRRRIAVLLGLVAVIIAIVLIIVRPGSGDGGTSAQPAEVPSDVAETPTAEPAAGEPVACAQSALEVVPMTDQGAYGADELPQLSLKVTNSGKDACIADLGTAGMQFVVASGSDEVWRSTDCQTGAESLPVKLDAGEALETEAIQWDRTRSSTETCDISRDAVGADGASYHLSAAAGGAESKETAQFLLY
ncbi:MAG: hypothetical protein KA158_04355 [Leucobacter sp.]|nr:hypothetical protein [Leucobacter sp.]